jgi:hypothetical protein
MRPRNIILTAAILTAFVAGLALIAGSSGEDKSAPAKTPLGPWARLVQMADESPRPREAWPFASLRGEPTAMPPALERKARETLGRGHRQLGLRFEHAQHLKTSLGFGIWILRGKGVTCMFHGTATLVACNATAQVSRYGLKMVGGDDPTPPPPGVLPDRFLAFGIAPDWARAVRVRIVGGASKTISIDDNTYVLRARAPINVEQLIR